jgi:DNA-binding transcriptional ArsR family regulator
MIQKYRNLCEKEKTLRTGQLKHFFRTLGLKVTFDNPTVELNIPYYLIKKYDYQIISIEDKDYILIQEKRKGAIENFFRQAKIISDVFGLSSLLLFNQMSNEDKVILWKLRIPYVSNERDIFLPDLGLIMKLTKEVHEITKFTGSEQLLMIYLLLYNGMHDSVSNTATDLGIARVTVYRALEKFREQGWLTKDHQLTSHRQKIFLELQNNDYFINPVNDVLYMNQEMFRSFKIEYERMSQEPILMSSYNALSSLSELSEDQAQYAISKQAYKMLEKNKENELSKYNFENMSKIEVWAYPPKLFKGNGLGAGQQVDPISLFLSLRDDEDPRVATAVEVLQEKIGQYLEGNNASKL